MKLKRANKASSNGYVGPEKRELVRKIRKLIGKNYSDDEVINELEIRPDVLRLMKATILEQDKMTFDRLSNDVVYSDYLMKQGNLIRELNNMNVRFRNRGQYSAQVSGIKLQSEIYDKCIKLGQDLGFIQKKAAELNLSAKMVVGAMSDAQVMAEVHKEVQDLNRLVKQHAIEMRPELMSSTGLNLFVPADTPSKKKRLALPAPEEDEEARPQFRKQKIKTEVTVEMKTKIPLLRRRVFNSDKDDS